MGRIEPVRASAGYRAGLLLVAMTMLVLPVLYVGLVGLVCFGLYWHATHDIDQSAFIGYAGPLIIGMIVLAFLIRPLLVRRRDDSVPLTLRRVDEPVLFEFIDRLCRALGSPAPVRIDVDLAVNASASFRGGLRGMFRRELVLTLGLPLAACLDARQFAGVLAHELGHFSQGSAMRLTYIVRRINLWFLRLVYYRDHWDRALARLSRRGNAIIMLVAISTRGMVWLVRRILWCLMTAGHAVSAMMMRQMEYDADRYQCRVAGSESFGRTFERLRCTSAAQVAAMSDLAAALRERRLADDMPAIICARERDMPEEVRASLRGPSPERKTRWFESHPCDSDRVSAATRQREPGIFTADAPATALFSDFPGLSRITTILYYRRTIGPKFQPGLLRKAIELVAARVEQEQTHDAMARYFHGLIDPVRPVFPDPVPSAPADRHAAAERLLDLRSRLHQREPAASEAAAKFTEHDERAAAVATVRELRTAGFRKSGSKDATLDSKSDDGLRAAEAAAKSSRQRAADIVNQAAQIGLERLALALSLESRPEEEKPPQPSEEEDFGEYELADEAPAHAADRAHSVLNGLRSVAADFEALRWHLLGLRVLNPRLQPHANGRPLIDAVLWHSRKASGLLRQIYQSLTQVAYPYAEPGQRLSLSAYLIPAMPPPEVPGRVAAAANSATVAYQSLYRRLLADLAARAEAVEVALGLPAQ